jgi:hypothetical protein
MLSPYPIDIHVGPGYSSAAPYRPIYDGSLFVAKTGSPSPITAQVILWLAQTWKVGGKLLGRPDCRS